MKPLKTINIVDFSEFGSVENIVAWPDTKPGGQAAKKTYVKAAQKNGFSLAEAKRLWPDTLWLPGRRLAVQVVFSTTPFLPSVR